MFSLKIHSVVILCGHEEILSSGIYDLSDHSSLCVGGRERGMGLAVPKEGNVMTPLTAVSGVSPVALVVGDTKHTVTACTGQKL